MTSHLLTKKLISISANHPIVLILARVYPSATNPQQLFLDVIFLNSKLLIIFFLGGRVGIWSLQPFKAIGLRVYLPHGKLLFTLHSHLVYTNMGMANSRWRNGRADYALAQPVIYKGFLITPLYLEASRLCQLTSFHCRILLYIVIWLCWDTKGKSLPLTFKYI